MDLVRIVLCYVYYKLSFVLVFVLGGSGAGGDIPPLFHELMPIHFELSVYCEIIKLFQVIFVISF